MSVSAIDSPYQIPDELWEKIVLLIPPQKPKKKPGRPRMDDRLALTAILYVLRTGCQWAALPRSLGPKSTVHGHFQEWCRVGFFKDLWIAGLMEYDLEKGIDWEWQSMDGAITKAPLGGEATGPSPVDRAKSGTKRSLLTEGKGIPIGIAVEKANRHDMKMFEDTLETIVIERPEVSAKENQNMCLDKGYDYDEIREIVAMWGYTAHIKTRGEEMQEKKEIPGYRARRWVVERTHSWLNRFRRLLIRWEKKVENYLGLLHFTCGWISFRAAGVFEP